MMNLPCFFHETLEPNSKQITFDEENSRHVVQVLRMKPKEILQITDGKGLLITAEIVDSHKKKCTVSMITKEFVERKAHGISIAISLLKNSHRFEWFLEKATEIGIDEIIPLLCDRTEKQHFRHERMKNICISAMVQSRQVWVPDLREPEPVASLHNKLMHQQRFIAHCNEGKKMNLADLCNHDFHSQIILIGPEGDFTPAEVEHAIQNSCHEVTLGSTRLRTETAGIVAAAILKNR